MSKQMSVYTNEFKQEAVSLGLKSPSISHAARELGIPMATLHTWVQKLTQGTDKAKQSAAAPEQNDASRLLAEIRHQTKSLPL